MASVTETPREPLDAKKRKRKAPRRNPARLWWWQNPDLWWNRNPRQPWCDNALDALLENWDQLAPPRAVKRKFRR